MARFLIGQLILNQSFDPTDLFRQHKPTMARYRGYANYHVRNNYHAHGTSIRDQYSTLDHQAKERRAQESSAPCRFNDKGEGAQN
jgi:hypothetical protein